MCGGAKKKRVGAKSSKPSLKTSSQANSTDTVQKTECGKSVVEPDNVKKNDKTNDVSNLNIKKSKKPSGDNVKALSIKKDVEGSNMVEKSIKSQKDESHYSSRYFTTDDRKKKDDPKKYKPYDSTEEKFNEKIDKIDKKTNETSSIISSKILSKKVCQSVYNENNCRRDTLTYNDIFGASNTVYNNVFIKKALNESENDLQSPEFKKATEIIANIISNYQYFHKEYLGYYAFLLDATLFFEINYQFLTALNVPRWNKNETFRKTTIVIVGNKLEENAKFISYLLKKEDKDILHEITQYPENNISFYRPDNNFNKNGPFGDLEQKFCDIDWVIFEKYRKSHLNSTTFSDSAFLEKYNILQLYDPVDKTNSSLNEINAINDYIFKKTDLTTIVLDDKKIDRNFKRRLKKLKPFSNKVLFAINVSNPSHTKKDITIKKEIIRWFVTDKFKKNKPVKIVTLNSKNLHFSDDKVGKVISYDMKCLNDWVTYHQYKALYNRCQEIIKCCKLAISYVLLLNGILHVDSLKNLISDEVIKDEAIKELKKKFIILAKDLKLPFNEEIVGPRIKLINVIKNDFKLPYLPLAFRYIPRLPKFDSFVPDEPKEEQNDQSKNK
uniref:FCP1 homology domain-containing protein n=1 Tax=Strongyloides papillosus TaxID=174720 RepID=A0A0N5BFK5_STREA